MLKEYERCVLEPKKSHSRSSSICWFPGVALKALFLRRAEARWFLELGVTPGTQSRPCIFNTSKLSHALSAELSEMFLAPCHQTLLACCSRTEETGFGWSPRRKPVSSQMTVDFSLDLCHDSKMLQILKNDSKSKLDHLMILIFSNQIVSSQNFLSKCVLPILWAKCSFPS